MILALNTATIQTAIALTHNGKVLFGKTWLANRDEGEKLLPAIQTALKKTKRSFDELEKIAVISGPGTFTGLRIGVAMANGLAFSQKVKVTSFGTFEYLQASLPAAKKKNTAIMVKAGGAYVAVLEPKAKKSLLIEKTLLPVWLKKKKNIRYLYADLQPEELKLLKQELKLVAQKWITAKELQSFGKTMVQLLTIKRPTKAIATPVYLRKPKITQSKKPNFN